MLTRPLTLADSEDRGRGLVAVTAHPALPLADDDDDDDDETQTGGCGFFVNSFLHVFYLLITHESVIGVLLVSYWSIIDHINLLLSICIQIF